MTANPNEAWMIQIARNVTMDGCGFDRDTKYTDSFRAIVSSGHVQPIKLRARSPNLNAFAERWLKSVKTEAQAKTRVDGPVGCKERLSDLLKY